MRNNWAAGGASWKVACDTEERSLGGSKLALLLEENMDKERVWSRSVASDVLPASLRGLKYVSRFSHSLLIQRIRFGKADVHTVVTLMDNTSQGPNQAFSSFTDGTEVRTRHQHPKQDLFVSSTPFVTGRQYTLIFNGSIEFSAPLASLFPVVPAQSPIWPSQASVPELH